MEKRDKGNINKGERGTGNRYKGKEHKIIEKI